MMSEQNPTLGDYETQTVQNLQGGHKTIQLEESSENEAKV